MQMHFRGCTSNMTTSASFLQNRQSDGALSPSPFYPAYPVADESPPVPGYAGFNCAPEGGGQQVTAAQSQADDLDNEIKRFKASHPELNMHQEPLSTETNLKRRLLCYRRGHFKNELKQKARHKPTQERDHFMDGFTACFTETIRFLAVTEGLHPKAGLCLRLCHHLGRFIEPNFKLSLGDIVNQKTTHNTEAKSGQVEGTKEPSATRSPVLPPKVWLQPPLSVPSSSSQTRSHPMLKGLSDQFTPRSETLFAPRCSRPADIQPCSSPKKIASEPGLLLGGNRKEILQTDCSKSAFTPILRQEHGKAFGLKLNTTDISGGDPLYLQRHATTSPKKCPDLSSAFQGGDAERLILPGFALHPAGTCYLPIRLDPMFVSRHALGLNLNEKSKANMHSLNISVYL